MPAASQVELISHTSAIQVAGSGATGLCTQSDELARLCGSKLASETKQRPTTTGIDLAASRKWSKFIIGRLFSPRWLGANCLQMLQAIERRCGPRRIVGGTLETLIKLVPTNNNNNNRWGNLLPLEPHELAKARRNVCRPTNGAKLAPNNTILLPRRHRQPKRAAYIIDWPRQQGPKHD